MINNFKRSILYELYVLYEYFHTLCNINNIDFMYSRYKKYYIVHFSYYLFQYCEISFVNKTFTNKKYGLISRIYRIIYKK